MTEMIVWHAANFNHNCSKTTRESLHQVQSERNYWRQQVLRTCTASNRGMYHLT